MMNKKAGTLAKNFELGGEIVFVWFVKGQRSSKISSKVSVHDDSDIYAFVRTKVCINAHHKPKVMCDDAFCFFGHLDSSSTFEDEDWKSVPSKCFPPGEDSTVEQVTFFPLI